MLDPYATLEIARDASQDDIKRSFRRLAKELHPDINPHSPSAARRFQDVTQAYDLLSNPAKRRAFDQEEASAARRPKPRERWTAESPFQRSSWATRGNTNTGNSNTGNTNAGSAGAQAKPNTGNAGNTKTGPSSQGAHTDQGARARDTSGGTRQSRATDAFLRGTDIHHTLSITFVEAALGARKRVVLPDQRSLEINVPPMTQDGHVLRLKGQGGAGVFGGSPGDLLVDVTVEAHPFFTRRGADIHMPLSITVPEAVMGASIVVQTVHGPVQIKVPPGSNTDTVLRLKGMGLIQPQGGNGDQFVTLRVMLPPASDDEFPKLVEAWSKRKPYRARPV